MGEGFRVTQHPGPTPLAWTVKFSFSSFVLEVVDPSEAVSSQKRGLDLLHSLG